MSNTRIVFAIVAFGLFLTDPVFAKGPEKPPGYLVHIDTESPRDRVSVFDDWASGILVDPRYVLTCNHNIEPLNTRITVHFGDKKVDAEVVARDVMYDLALLKLKKVVYEKPVEISDSRARPGDLVTIWGHPGDGFGKATKYTGDVARSTLRGGRWFRANVGIELGVSGGPVLVDDKLVGVARGSFLWSEGAVCVNTPQILMILENIGD